jgi:hypothetical protein
MSEGSNTSLLYPILHSAWLPYKFM